MKVLQKKSQIFLYVALILLPLILSAALYFQMRSVINNEIERRSDQTLMQFYYQTSGMIRELHSFASYLADDIRINQVLNSEHPESIDQAGFCNYLSSAALDSRNINHVLIISERSGKIYSNSGCYTYDSLSTLLKRIGLISQDYDFDRTGIDWSLYNESGYAPYCVTPVKSNTAGSSGETIGYIIAALDYSRFMDIFRSLDASVCAVYSDNFYISSIIDMDELNNLDWNDQSLISRLVNEPVTCVYRSDSDYNYMVGIANREYYQPLRILLRGFAIYFIVILLAGAFILWRLLSRRKRESQHQLLERNLRYIVYGHNDQISNKQFVMETGLPQDPQTTYVISVFFVESVKKRTFHDLEKIVLESIENTPLHCTYFEDLTGPVFIFWMEPDSDTLADEVSRFSHSLTQQFIDFIPEPVQICISEPAKGISMLGNAFHRATDLHYYSKKQGNTGPVLMNRNSAKDQSVQNSSSFTRAHQHLIHALLAGKFDQIPDMVRQIQKDHIDPIEENIEYARTLRRTVANILACFIMESNLSEEDKEAALNEFRHAMHGEELNNVTEKYFSMTSAINTSDNKDASAYQEADTFIKEHLHDHNLSVAMICDAMGMGVQKLTRIFHNYNDMPIAEYVNKLRTMEAQELLHSRKDLSVTDIAETVGYNNPHSLTRNFRKFTGLTPTEFRELEK